MNRQQLSAILKEHRVNNGVLLKRICAQMDTGESTIYRIEKGLYNFNCDMWIDYMNAIGVIAKITRNNKSVFINSANDVVEFIKNARSEQEVSQRALAKMINVANMTIANLERGYTRVAIDVFLSVVNTFGYELQILDKVQSNNNDK